MDIIAQMTAGIEAPRISVVIPNFNGAPYLESCLDSLRRQTCPPFEIIVVDNASTDDSAAVVGQAAPQAIWLPQKENRGFAGGVNAGIMAARGEWVALLNNDATVNPCWIEEALAAIRRCPDASFLACRILEKNREGRIYSAGDCFLRTGTGYRRGQELPDRSEYLRDCEIFAACGCAALYRKDVLLSCGLFDEDFFAYFEDVDLGLRLRVSGCRGYFAHRCEVVHLGGGTSGGEFSPFAVRMRTRNALLLLIKSVPAAILLKCLPMILASQFVWLGRVLVHGRFWSYIEGLGGVFPLIPAMLARRKTLRKQWDGDHELLWKDILESESLARRDFMECRGGSSFLRWYFDCFQPPGQS
jgi:GT2 family glycosyltransferase